MEIPHGVRFDRADKRRIRRQPAQEGKHLAERQPSPIEIEQVGLVVALKVRLDRLGILPQGTDEASYSPVDSIPASFTSASSSEPPSLTVGFNALNAS